MNLVVTPIIMPENLYFRATGDRIETVHLICAKTGLGIGELLRRILDHSFQEPVLNQIIPSMSGKLRIDELGQA